MLAAILKGVNDLVLEDIPRPSPGPGEVLVKVRATGICGTDYKALRGKRTNVEFPLIMGHENSGVVAEVGPGVGGIAAGDEVIVSPIGGCGICKWCRLGQVHLCRDNYTTGGEGAPVVLPGGFAEYMLAPRDLIFAKPAAISFEKAALTEPLSCVWKAMVEYSRMRAGEDVVVIGCGGIGLLAVMLARAAAGARVVAVDVSDYALTRALKCGATHAMSAAGKDAAAVREEVFEALPEGPDFVIEAAGVAAAVETMLALRRRATRLCIFGTTTPAEVTVDAGSLNNMETSVFASFSTTPVAMTRAIELLERGVVPAEKAISHTFPLADIHKAFDVMDTAERDKVMIVQE